MNPLLSVQAELERAYAASDAYLAIVRRVHAECGPVNRSAQNIEYGWLCLMCHREDKDRAKIYHKPNCLHQAAEAVLRKAGQL